MAVMVALLAAALWYCVSIWWSTPSMPLYGNVIMGVAALMALAAGSGLIALMYYSQRKGHDQPARNDRTARK
jgi:hypothetical protein